MRLIDADKIEDIFDKRLSATEKQSGEKMMAIYTCLTDIWEAPTIVMPEIKQGKWLRIDDGGTIEWRCSQCGMFVEETRMESWRYCPICGSRNETDWNVSKKLRCEMAGVQ